MTTKTQRRQRLWCNALDCEREFTQALAKVRKTPVNLYLTETDRLRLLTLRAWSLKYKISLQWIVAILMQHYQTITKRRRTKTALGIRIATLCSQSSQNYLEEQLVRQFPEEENIAAWRSKTQSQQLQNLAPPKVFDLLNLADNYDHWIQQSRKRRQQAETKFKQWQYRDNPWL